MKKLLFFFILIPFFSAGQKQTDTAFQKQMANLRISIEKALPKKGMEFKKNECEYFLYDITLGIKGEILNADLVRRNSSVNFESAEKLLPLIKEKWIPVQSGYRKVFIPVFFVFDCNDPETKATDPGDMMKVLVELFSKGKKSRTHKGEIYIAENIVKDYRERGEERGMMC